MMQRNPRLMASLGPSVSALTADLLMFSDRKLRRSLEFKGQENPSSLCASLCTMGTVADTISSGNVNA
jgi:hypothetical protein